MSPTADDPFNLERFVTAQNDGGTYARAVQELRQGYKTSHWMWFVFPQIAGLGHSPMSREFAISSLTEAQAYLAHPVLGPRLIACTEALCQPWNLTAEQILGSIDAQKLHSSMTLFLRGRARRTALPPGARSLLRRHPRPRHGRAALTTACDRTRIDQ